MQNLTVAVVQQEIVPNNPQQNLATFSRALKDLKNCDLIALPEVFTTGFCANARNFAEHVDGTAYSWMADHAKQLDAVITGSLVVKEGDTYFNRMVWMRPDGSYTHYDKRHLFGLGDEDKNFSPGKNKLIVELKGWKIRLAICYDLRFPVWLRNVNEEYDILLLVASWPDKRSAHWRALIPARAIENQSYVIAVNRVGHDGNQVYHGGHSMVIDPYGSTVYYKPEDEDMYTVTINYEELVKIRRQFPFLKDADKFVIEN